MKQFPLYGVSVIQHLTGFLLRITRPQTFKGKTLISVVLAETARCKFWLIPD